VLEVALRARLPMIAASTTDLLNIADLLRFMTEKIPGFAGKEPIKIAQKLDLAQWDALVKEKPQRLFYTSRWEQFVGMDTAQLYEALVLMESTLVILNAPLERRPLECHDVGTVPTPKAFLKRFLSGVFADNETMVEEVLPAFGGLTLKQVGELIRLCWAEKNDLTARGLREIRKQSIGPTRGIVQVSVDLTSYKPEPDLEAWVQREKPYFLDGKDARLVPRGLLFGGPPGTGKTFGAKYIAEEFGVPLYRLDLGAIKGKYVGESEHAMLAALQQIDCEEPAVLLVDEVEKMFSGSHGDSTGVSMNLMASLLWWLAEHRSRVLTVMTCNKMDVIPKEMYREGRVDRVFEFDGLQHSDAVEFAKWYAKTFGVEFPPLVLEHRIAKLPVYNGPGGANDQRYSQAKIVQLVHDLVKENLKLSE